MWPLKETPVPFHVFHGTATSAVIGSARGRQSTVRLRPCARRTHSPGQRPGDQAVCLPQEAVKATQTTGYPVCQNGMLGDTGRCSVLIPNETSLEGTWLWPFPFVASAHFHSVDQEIGARSAEAQERACCTPSGERRGVCGGGHQHRLGLLPSKTAIPRSWIYYKNL